MALQLLFVKTLHTLVYEVQECTMHLPYNRHMLPWRNARRTAKQVLPDGNREVFNLHAKGIVAGKDLTIRLNQS